MNRVFVVTTATLTAVIGVLVGVLLSVERPARSIERSPSQTASSASDGTYALRSLPAGRYVLVFADPDQDECAGRQKRLDYISAVNHTTLARRAKLCLNGTIGGPGPLTSAVDGRTSWTISVTS